jgi:hypothetical protein
VNPVPASAVRDAESRRSQVGDSAFACSIPAVRIEAVSAFRSPMFRCPKTCESGGLPVSAPATLGKSTSHALRDGDGRTLFRYRTVGFSYRNRFAPTVAVAKRRRSQFAARV